MAWLGSMAMGTAGSKFFTRPPKKPHRPTEPARAAHTFAQVKFLSVAWSAPICNANSLRGTWAQVAKAPRNNHMTSQ